MLCLGLFTPPVFANRYAPLFSRCRVGKKCRAGDGSDATAGLPLRTAANAYRVIVPPMTSEMMNLVKTRPSPRLSVWWIWRRRRVNCRLLGPRLGVVYRHHAGVCIDNAFIMLVMTLVERKVRLPGTWGANNVRV